MEEQQADSKDQVQMTLVEQVTRSDLMERVAAVANCGEDLVWHVLEDLRVAEGHVRSKQAEYGRVLEDSEARLEQK